MRTIRDDCWRSLWVGLGPYYTVYTASYTLVRTYSSVVWSGPIATVHSHCEMPSLLPLLPPPHLHLIPSASPSRYIRSVDLYSRDPTSAIPSDALHLSQMASSSALPPLSSRSFLVLYASQTGTAVDISHRIARRGRREGWSVAVQDVATFDQVRPPPPRVP